jgi:ATP-dependent DNA helicase RecQ
MLREESLAPSGKRASGVRERAPGGRGAAAEPAMAGDPLFDALRAWRKKEAEEQGVPAYVIFHNAALDAIAAARPRDAEDLAMVPGVGRSKLERYADAVLKLVREHAG